MTWDIYTIAKAKLDEDANNAVLAMIMEEMDRLKLQRCPECSGYGHSAKRCPTTIKVNQLTTGIRKQAAVIKAIRATVRAKEPAKPVKEKGPILKKNYSPKKRKILPKNDLIDSQNQSKRRKIID